MIIDKNNYDCFLEEEEDEYDEFLQGASIELLMDCVTKQFKNLESRKQNYIEQFYKDYKATVARLEDADDAEVPTWELQELEQGKEKFLAHVAACYMDYLSIGIPNFGDYSSEDQEEMLDMLYRYFFKRMKKNFISVVRQYIDKSPNLGDEFEDRMDVTTKSYEGIFSPSDIKIISNLDEIINMALSADYTVDEFIDATLYTDAGSTEPALFIKDAFDDTRLTGNFVSYYIAFVSETQPDIVSSLRQYIFSKYPDGEDTDASTDLGTDYID